MTTGAWVADTQGWKDWWPDLWADTPDSGWKVFANDLITRGLALCPACQDAPK